MSCCPTKSKKCKRNCGNKSRGCNCDNCRSSHGSSSHGSSSRKNCPPKPCLPECPDRSDVGTDVASVYNDEATDPIADGAQIPLPSTNPGTAGITITQADDATPDSGTRLTVCNTGLYRYDFSVRGTTPFVGDEGSAPLRAQLALGSEPDEDEAIDGTLRSSPGVSPTLGEDVQQEVHGFGTILLAAGDVVSLLNASGADVTLADDEAVSAALMLTLVESRPDCR